MAEIAVKDLPKYENSIVWICDYRYKDFDNKPIRHIKPTRVLVRANSAIKKKIYYSTHHFVELNKKDEPVSSKIYAPFDNTGYRMYPGVPVKILETEQHANDMFASLAEVAYKEFEVYKKNKIAALESLQKEILSYLPNKTT